MSNSPVQKMDAFEANAAHSSEANVSSFCKVDVILLARYAAVGVMLCSNDCFPAENGCSFFGRYCMQVLK